MSNDFDQLYEGERYQKRSKKRRVKRFILTGISILIVIFVGFKLIGESGKNPAVSLKQTEQGKSVDISPVDDAHQATNQFNSNHDKQIEVNNGTEVNNNSEGQESADITEVTEAEAAPSTPSAQSTKDHVVNVIKDKWEPIGTVQSEPHTANYTKGSDDWNEMIKAVSLATGLTENNMIVWWLGNNGGANKSIATVTSKDMKQIYRISLEWITEQGWKPTKVEQLKENPYNQS